MRRTVFVEEQGVPAELEQSDEDGHDGVFHVLARDAAGSPIATGRMLPDGLIGRMAVLPEWRGRGLGRAVMALLMQAAESAGLDRVYLNSQLSALGFYRQLGFVAEGEDFVDAGIVHHRMSLALGDWDPTVLDQGGTVLHGVADSAAAALRLIAAARRRLVLYTPFVHPRLYGPAAIAEALAARVTDEARFQCRLLLPAASIWRRECPRLAELTARLGALELRRWPDDTARDRAEFGLGFLIADDEALLLHDDPRVCGGRYLRHGGQQVRKLSGFFTEAWEQSVADAELRRLGI